MGIDRKKYMDLSEIKHLRETTAAWAALDLQRGRQQGIKAWMIVDLATSTGLRVGEIVSLDIEDIDLRRGLLTVVRLKRRTKRPESLAISNGLRDHLRQYIENEGRDKGPLLNSQRRDRMTAIGASQVWKTAITRAGLPRELSIHSARHTVAVHLLKKTKNLRLVQKQLGHSSPATTANMYCDIEFDDMLHAVNGLYQ